MKRYLGSKSIMSAIAIVVAIVVMAFLVRGVPGNPSPLEIEYFLNNSGQIFETSQERSRWALLLSLYNEKSVAIDTYASMGTPDIGYINGHYYSFFPPLISIFALPFYWLGLLIGNTTIAVFTMPILFSMATMCLLYKFAMKLELSWKTSLLTALGFGFATSALAYSVTIFAHIVSAFFILLGVYVATFKLNASRYWYWIVWGIYSIVLFLDFPNIFLFFPIALYTFYKSFDIANTKKVFSIGLNWRKLLGVLVIILALGGYGYYNYINFGNPAILSNTIPRVTDIKSHNELLNTNTEIDASPFYTRNLLNGLYTFILSIDRGILRYSPILLLFILGIGKSKNKTFEGLAVSVIFTMLVLYSMFGDPYGGWAFGSRYMVAVMPELMLLVGIGFKNSSFRLKRLFYSAVVLYSSAIVLTAAMTTNLLPPKVEAEPLGLGYTDQVNWSMLFQNKLNPYVYNYVLDGSLTGIQYFLIVYIPLSFLFLYLIWSKKEYEN